MISLLLLLLSNENVYDENSIENSIYWECIAGSRKSFAPWLNHKSHEAIPDYVIDQCASALEIYAVVMKLKTAFSHSNALHWVHLVFHLMNNWKLVFDLTTRRKLQPAPIKMHSADACRSSYMPKRVSGRTGERANVCGVHCARSFCLKLYNALRHTIVYCSRHYWYFMQSLLPCKSHVSKPNSANSFIPNQKQRKMIRINVCAVHVQLYIVHCILKLNVT